MGTTFDEPLYYMNSTRILARTGLHFYLTFTHSLKAHQVFGAVVGEKFIVNIDNNTIDYTLDQFCFIYLFLPINFVLVIFPISFWGNSLQTAVYIFNVVPSKSIHKTPLVLWNEHKPSLCHFHIWGCPAHMLKGKTRKLEPRTEVCMFVGYPKGIRGGLFYCPSGKKVFVSINVTFLKDDYMTNFKPRSKVVLEELLFDQIRKSPSTTDERQSQETILFLFRISWYLDVVGG